jgi:hypothetical protein
VPCTPSRASWKRRIGESILSINYLFLLSESTFV